MPRVLLAEIGDVKMRSARSNFAANFFACAGFDIVTQRFDERHRDCGQRCRSYRALQFRSGISRRSLRNLLLKLKALGRKTPVIVAGNPESAEQLRAAGVADFIHLRSNPIEVLTNWQQQLGIKA